MRVPCTIRIAMRIKTIDTLRKDNLAGVGADESNGKCVLLGQVSKLLTFCVNCTVPCLISFQCRSSSPNPPSRKQPSHGRLLILSCVQKVRQPFGMVQNGRNSQTRTPSSIYDGESQSIRKRFQTTVRKGKVLCAAWNTVR